MKYLKTTIEEVDAIQFTGNNEQAVRELLGEDAHVQIRQIDKRENSTVLEFRTEFSCGKARIGEWIIVEANKFVKVLPQEIFELGYQKDSTPWDLKEPREKKIIVSLDEFVGKDKLSLTQMEIAKLTVKFCRELEKIEGFESEDSIPIDIVEVINSTMLLDTKYSIMFPDTHPAYWLAEFGSNGIETGRIAYLEDVYE
jgi:hypothetical protein